MDIALRKIEPFELELFRREMKKSFEQGILDRFGDISFAPIPPENEVDKAVKDISSDVFIITVDHIPAGGTIIKKEKKFVDSPKTSHLIC